MLLAINDRIKGWLGIVIVALIGMTFALWGIQSYLDDSGPSYAAKVNGIEISSGEFERSVSIQRQNILRQNDGKMPIDEKVLRERTLTQLIDQRLLENNAYEEGYRISDALLSERIRQIFTVDGVFDRDRLESSMRQLNMSVPMYEYTVRNELRLQQMQTAIAGSAFITNKAANDLAILNEQSRDISVLTFNIDHFSGAAEPTEDEVKQYYESNLSRFKVPEKVKVDYVEITSDQLSSQVEIDEAQIEKMYDDYVASASSREERKASHILLTMPQTVDGKKVALEKIQALKKDLDNGADFAEVAKQFSEDKASAVNGGDLGWVALGDMARPFELALFNLKPGTTSEVVETQFGYHLIQLNEVRSEELEPIGVKRYQFEDEIRADSVASLFYDQSERLATLAYENPDNLDIAVEELALKIQTSDEFDRNSGQGIASNKKLREIAFSPLVLESGSNSDIIEISPDHVVVIRLNKHIPSVAKPIADVSFQIENILKVKNGHEKTRVAAMDVKSKLASGENIANVLTDGINLEKLSALHRGDSSRVSDRVILQTAFDIAVAGEAAASVRDVDLMSGDVALVVLDAIHTEENVLQSKIDIVKNELMRDTTVRDYSSAVLAIKENADIEKNNRIVDR